MLLPPWNCWCLESFLNAQSKMEATAMYAKSTGCPALMSNVERLSDALEGEAITWIEL
jgi:hypothetical protein